MRQSEFHGDIWKRKFGVPAFRRLGSLVAEMRISGELLEGLYPDLRRIASAHLRRERPGHTLQTTALVHEAFLKLAGWPQAPWSDKASFCAAAIRVIRQVLMDHARRRKRAKRGGLRAQRICISAVEIPSAEPSWDYADLHEALNELEAIHPRVARVVELRFLCGLADGEVAEALSCTRRTVLRDWRFARAWLAHRLGEATSLTEVAPPIPASLPVPR